MGYSRWGLKELDMTEQLSNCWETGCPIRTPVSAAPCPPRLRGDALCHTHQSADRFCTGEMLAVPHRLQMSNRGMLWGFREAPVSSSCGAGKILCPGHPAPPRRLPRRAAPSPPWVPGPASGLGKPLWDPCLLSKPLTTQTPRDSASAFLCLRVNSVLRQECILFFFKEACIIKLNRML